MNLNIIFEDDDIIICEKPAGVPAQSDKTSDFDMVNRLKNYIYEKTQKQPYIGLIHRLDRPVGGIMLFAKTPYAAKDLSEQIRLKKITKKYLAVVTSDLAKELGQDKKLITDYLVKDGRTNLSKITTEKDKNGKKAELYYKVNKVLNRDHFKDSINKNESNILSLIEVELITGRHHQIRVQMASRGCPLWGDTKYNSNFTDKDKMSKYRLDNKNNKWTDVALYAYYLEFSHPRTNKNMIFELLPKDKIFEIFNN